MRKLVVLFAVMVGVVATAQRRGHEKGEPGNMKDLTLEQMATLQTKRMTLALDLTDSQQKQIQSVNLENAAHRMEKMDEMKERRESGERKKLSTEERYSMQIAMLDRQIAQKAKMKQILNKDQYAKWEKLKLGEGKRKGKRTEGRRERGKRK
ncbi:hypothetical protein EHW67_03270 [Arenibacter aquaticus]|uniref:DUF4890 domain-containing protein n=1 Tax=Arenibacter aquaticus TaxID=2489054 RepID=A0A430K578_9FLAO|nr:hypothetical protein [Arenibacter aquaticus]RTE54201.1 hypothetical protein EHW67_03270 [Arenibacter aquaticus]